MGPMALHCAAHEVSFSRSVTWLPPATAGLVPIPDHARSFWAEAHQTSPAASRAIPGLPRLSRPAPSSPSMARPVRPRPIRIRRRWSDRCEAARTSLVSIRASLLQHVNRRPTCLFASRRRNDAQHPASAQAEMLLAGRTTQGSSPSERMSGSLLSPFAGGFRMQGVMAVRQAKLRPILVVRPTPVERICRSVRSVPAMRQRQHLR